MSRIISTEQIKPCRLEELPRSGGGRIRVLGVIVAAALRPDHILSDLVDRAGDAGQGLPNIFERWAVCRRRRIARKRSSWISTNVARARPTPRDKQLRTVSDMGDVLYIDQLKAAVIDVDPDGINKADFSAPAGDVTPTAFQVIRPGVITIGAA